MDVDRLVAALRSTLDEQERGSQLGGPWWSRLIERDRALLDAYVTAKAEQDKAAERMYLVNHELPPGSVKDGWMFAGRVNTLRAEVERAAKFWLGPHEGGD